MTNVLALDTSGTFCSVALLQDTETSQYIHSRHEKAERSHTQCLLPMIEEVLHEADIQRTQLDAIVYGRGPGSFTGIRIAAGVAQGLAFGLNLPLIPVSTLATLALASHSKIQQKAAQTSTVSESLQYLACIDARMQEVYTATYGFTADSNVIVVDPERVCPPDSIQVPKLAYSVCGNGAALAEFPAAITNNAQWIDVEVEPEAQYMAILGQQTLVQGGSFLPEDALPVYLRDEVTWQRLPRFQG